MGSRYLHEEPGWTVRANGSGGYDAGQPTHIMCHHTASPPTSDGQRDVDYICYGSTVKPISNLYLSRSGEVWVCAAGRTNTNGLGSSVAWNGGVPDNKMNAYAIGIEAANRGTGEPWPQAQQDAYVALCSALSLHYDIPVNHVRSHHEWTSRKIDPAGESRYATGSAKWNMDAFRSDVLLYDPSPPQPPTPSEGNMLYIATPKYPGANANSEWWCIFESGAVRRAVNSDVAYANMKGIPLVDQTSAEHDAYLRSIAMT
jgi:N-acetylmuramoyl-L-alanine amidase